MFHTALFIIELYILSVAMPMFGLCSNLGNTVVSHVVIFIMLFLIV